MVGEPAARQRCVVVLDDDRAVRSMIRAILEPEGFQVVDFANGLQALEQLKGAPRPDLIILDLRMPQMDGWEFREAQKRDALLRTVPVLAISGMQTAGEAGIDADAYLAKPIAPQALRDAVQQLMRAVERERERGAASAQAERMAALGVLAAGVAHEINNPLSYVLANLKILRDQLGELAAPAGAERDAQLAEFGAMLQEAIQGAERIGAIVKDVQLFSRSAEDDSFLTLDVRAVVETAIRLVANEIRHRARLVRELEPTPPVNANAGRLAEVFVNLLVNAAQAVRTGAVGRNQIRVRSGTTDAGFAMVEISDSGEGMAPEVAARVFEPFFTTRPVGEGTGLGLSVAHGIVQKLGGRIEVSSERGRGSQFRVLLPPARPHAPSAGRRTRAERARILVIDDEVSLAKAIKRALDLEYEAVVVTSGREALEFLAREPFDLILCDLLMEEVTGMEVYAAVRSRMPQLVERFVFMTGGAFTDRAKSFLAEVQHPVIDKPFEIDDLLELVADRLAAL